MLRKLFKKLSFLVILLLDKFACEHVYLLIGLRLRETCPPKNSLKNPGFCRASLNKLTRDSPLNSKPQFKMGNGMRYTKATSNLNFFALAKGLCQSSSLKQYFYPVNPLFS
jgi:hypothetical protein